MTEQQKQHAAEVLIGTKALNGGEDGKFLPKLYVVNGQCYMFLNVARRAALGTEYPIEVLSIEEAWQTHLHLPAGSLDQKAVDWEWDSTGSTYDGCLFCDNKNIYPGMVPNPVINAATNRPAIDAILDTDVNRLFLSIRAQNILTQLKCKTYRDVILFGRDRIFKVRNMGVTTLASIDAEMDRVGLWDYWKYNKSIK